MFTPLLKPVIWGGSRIARYKRLSEVPESVGESWEISGLPGQESVVDGGSFEGFSLNELIRLYGCDLLGTEVVARSGENFPLLIKFIDANRNLSVQVHPDGEMGKNEMWYVIDAGENAEIIHGLKQPLSKEEFDSKVADDSILEAVNHYPSARGQFFNIPAGTIHSIGAGNLIAEVQQASDVTYRVYDYNRLDRNGQPRELHVDEAFKALRDIRGQELGAVGRVYDDSTIGVVESPSFKVDYLRLADTDVLCTSDGSTFAIIIVIDGEVSIAVENKITKVAGGRTALVPACIPRYVLSGRGTVLYVRP